MRESWELKRVGDVATLQRGFDLPLQDRVPGNVPIISSSGRCDTHHEAAVEGPGIITGRSGSIGSVFFVEEDFWPLNTSLYVKDFCGNDPRFIYHLLIYLDLNRFASGAGVPTLNRNHVHDEIVPVPPLPEQQRIVALLDEAFAGLATAKANAEQNLQNARAIFQGHLDSFFVRCGEHWALKELGEVCEFENGDRGENYPNKSARTVTGVPFINAGHLTQQGLDMESMDFISRERFDLLGAGKVRPRDVLFCLRGSLGKCASVGDLVEGAIASSLIIVELSRCAADFNRQL